MNTIGVVLGLLAGVCFGERMAERVSSKQGMVVQLGRRARWSYMAAASSR